MVGRRWLAAVAVLLVGVGVVGYRVLAPAETLDPAKGAYPSPTVASPRRLGALTSMPLIVDDRLRVYAEKRRVWADADVTVRAQTSPYWAYRRWPAQVVGVVTVEAGVAGAAGAPPVVVTRWSDGALVALDARRGRVVWRASVAGGGAYHGRLTGAGTVYQPSGMFTARGASDGRTVLVVADGRLMTGYDPRSGARLWAVGLRACQAVAWTGGTTVVVTDGCAGPATLRVFDAADGRALASWQPPVAGDGEAVVTPWGCGPVPSGRSGCVLLQVEGGGDRTQWRLGRDGSVVREPYAKSGDFLLGDDGFVEHRADSYVSVVDRATGRQRWFAPLSGYVVAADERGVYAVSRRDTLLVFDPVSGSLVRRLPMRDYETGAYTAGQVYLHDHYLAMERVTGKPNDSDSRYYYGTTPVLLMAV